MHTHQCVSKLPDLALKRIAGRVRSRSLTSGHGTHPEWRTFKWSGYLVLKMPCNHPIVYDKALSIQSKIRSCGHNSSRSFAKSRRVFLCKRTSWLPQHPSITELSSVAVLNYDSHFRILRLERRLFWLFHFFSFSSNHSNSVCSLDVWCSFRKKPLAELISRMKPSDRGHWSLWF